jgi:tetratricopeptide (TPR) repeat protein
MWRQIPRARFILALMVVVALGSGLWYSTILAHRGKLIVLLISVDGPAPQAIQITEGLATALADPQASSEIRGHRLRSVISEEQGSSRALALGRRQRAVLVVWGSVKSRGPEPFVTVVVENLAPLKSLRFPLFGEYVGEGELTEPSRVVLTKPLNDALTPSVLLAKMALRYQLGHWMEAFRLLSALLESAPPEGRDTILLSRGNAALLSGMTQQALEDYSRVLQADPTSLTAHTNLGLAYAIFKNHTQALAESTLALTIDSGHEAPYLNRGVSYAFLGEHQRAIADYDRVLRLNPRAATAYLNRGVSRAAMGDHQQAIEDFSHALDIEPEAAAFHNRGLSLAALGDHRQAIENFSRALRMEPADPSALVGRGRSRSALGDQVGAIADHTAALGLDPQLAAAYYERGIASMVVGKHQQALDDFSAAIRLNPESADAYKGRGLSRLLRREYPQALDDFTRAIQLAPQDAEAFFHRGVIYRLQGNPLKAVPDMEQTLKLSRDAVLRRQAQEQLQQIRSEP